MLNAKIHATSFSPSDQRQIHSRFLQPTGVVFNFYPALKDSRRATKTTALSKKEKRFIWQGLLIWNPAKQINSTFNPHVSAGRTWINSAPFWLQRGRLAAHHSLRAHRKVTQTLVLEMSLGSGRQSHGWCEAALAMVLPQKRSWTNYILRSLLLDSTAGDHLSPPPQSIFQAILMLYLQKLIP